jgi:hypothetical protein
MLKVFLVLGMVVSVAGCVSTETRRCGSLVCPSATIVLHFDGLRWSRVVVKGKPQELVATRRFVAFAELVLGKPVISALVRPAP